MLEMLRASSAKTRIALTLVFVVLAAAVILACGSATGTTTTGGSGTSAPTATVSVAKVGSTITQDNVACTLVSVQKISGDGVINPKPGNTFIVVHVKIVNHSSSNFDYNEADFNVESGSGNVTGSEIPPSTYTANNELNSGTLTPGGSVEGDIVFQVGISDHKARLTWQPNVFGDVTQNAWLLGI
jgi:hypothetical protein